jgi:hypothetical protein
MSERAAARRRVRRGGDGEKREGPAPPRADPSQRTGSHPGLPETTHQKKEKPARGGLSFFFYSKFRIPNSKNYRAKLFEEFWLVSGELSEAITLDFARGA